MARNRLELGLVGIAAVATEVMVLPFVDVVTPASLTCVLSRTLARIDSDLLEPDGGQLAVTEAEGEK